MSDTATLAAVIIRIAGAAMNEQAASTLEEVRVQQRLSQPSLCELKFVQVRERLLEVENIKIGTSIKLSLPEDGSALFTGEVTAIEHEYTPQRTHIIRLRAYDKLHRLRKRQPVKAHVQVTPCELARALTADLGITVEALRDGPLSQQIIQYRQSDLDLLISVCRRSGLYPFLHDDVLRLLTLEGEGEAAPLQLGKNLFEARLSLNADPACRTVITRGWNASRVEAHEGRADSPLLGREVSNESSPELFASNGESTLADQVLVDDLHANAIAQAELDSKVAREAALWGIAEGDPALTPGARVEIIGGASGFSGVYVLTSVTHSINRRTGFISELSSTPPTLPAPQLGADVVWGRVTSVEDPEQMGRVRAALPTLGNVETGWVGVMAAGAGGGKGFAVLPDVGDQVLVLFLGGDPAQAVVLGGLYGEHGPGDYGVDGASVRRYTIGTAGGQKFTLDDVGQSVRIENKGGSYIDLSPEKVLLYSIANFEIQAPGNQIVISAKSIDFRQA